MKTKEKGRASTLLYLYELYASVVEEVIDEETYDKIEKAYTKRCAETDIPRRYTMVE